MLASECAFDEVRSAAVRDELRDHRGLPCAPGCVPKDYFAPPVLAELEHLGVVASAQMAPGPSPLPTGLQAPFRSVVAANRPGKWEETGVLQEAIEDKIARAFVKFGSTEVARQDSKRAHRRARPRQGP